MELNFLKNLSIPRIAGVTSFIVLDIYKNYLRLSYIKRKEPFYKIKQGVLNPESVSAVTETESFNNYSEINPILKNFINRNSVANGFLIIGINEFKISNVTIPNEAEDTELWFLENTSKFLPEGRPAGEFSYTYEQYKKDDNYKYFLAAVAREDYLKEILKACSIEGFDIVNLYPLFLSYLSLKQDKNNNGLLLTFSAEKMNYLFVHKSGNVLSGEMFSRGQENGDKIYNNLKELNQVISLSFNEESPEPLEITASYDPAVHPDMQKILNSAFETENINMTYKDLNPLSINSFLGVSRLLKDFDYQSDFIGEEKLTKSRFAIEKQLSLRIILSLGIFIIAMLLFSYAAEWYFQSQVEEQSAEIVNAGASSVQVERLEKENQSLTANLSLLSKLKGNRRKFSDLLSDISEDINERSCLTALNISGKINSGVSMEMTGLAYTQQDVAALIRKIEENKDFREVKLLYSNSIEVKNIRIKNLSPGKNLVQFNISADYYGN